MKADEGQEEDEQSRQGFHLDPLMLMDYFQNYLTGSFRPAPILARGDYQP